MINVLKQLIFTVDSDTQTVYAYLRLFGVPVTKTELATLLHEHPDTGALLSVSDALTSLGIENAVAKVSAGQLDRLEIPFIARLKAGDGLSLAVVKRFDDDAVVYLPPAEGATPGQQRWVTTNKQTFSNGFDGIVLISEAEPGAGQADYASSRAVAAAFAQQGWTTAQDGDPVYPHVFCGRLSVTRYVFGGGLKYFLRT